MFFCSCTTDPNEGEFISKIIAAVRAMGANGNLYASGSSNGAALSHKLAVNSRDGIDLLFNGIVTKTTQLLQTPQQSGPGPYNYNQPGLNNNNQMVSVLNIMGLADGLINYDGGYASVFSGDKNFSLMSALESNVAWAIQNGCNTVPIVSNVSAAITIGPFNDRTTINGKAEYYVYNGCDGGHFVEHYKVFDGDHGSTPGASINGKSANDVQFEFIWKVENSTKMFNAQNTMNPTANPSANTGATTSNPSSYPTMNPTIISPTQMPSSTNEIVFSSTLVDESNSNVLFVVVPLLTAFANIFNS